MRPLRESLKISEKLMVETGYEKI